MQCGGKSCLFSSFLNLQTATVQASCACLIALRLTPKSEAVANCLSEPFREERIEEGVDSAVDEQKQVADRLQQTDGGTVADVDVGRPGGPEQPGVVRECEHCERKDHRHQQPNDFLPRLQDPRPLG